MGRYLITPDEFLTVVLRHDTEVTLLDVRWELGRDDGRVAYDAGHAPGAAYVDLDADLAGPPGHGGRHPLPDPDDFAAAMRRCGVRGDLPVVVYDDWNSAAAARCWWLLRHHGHTDVRVLDGGWEAWKESGGAIETNDPHVAPGDFEADGAHLPTVDAEGVRAYAEEGRLVDVRPAARFSGEDESTDPVAGHVPGAVNVPTAEHLEGRRVDLDVVGRYPRGEVAVSCGSGVTAALAALVLAEAGREPALYPGSWSDWISDPSRPVVTGRGPHGS